LSSVWQPYFVNCQKLIGLPDFSAMPSTMTLAEAPTAVTLPPRSAPRASAHHNTCDCRVPSAATSSATTGLIVATYGMLSTMADRIADPHCSPIEASSNRPSTASAAARDTCSITPVSPVHPP
jgi:hypothetical protein